MMKKLTRFFLLLTWLTILITQGPNAVAANPASTPSYLVTNDDSAGLRANSATFFTVAADGTLSNPTQLNVGGIGSGGGYFAANRVSIENSASSSCIYFSAGSSNTIAGVQATTHTLTGNYSASATDSGADNGIGLATNANYLYASFSSSATIATFAVQSGCTLQFLSDISPAGLNGGTAKGMALYRNLMVVTYGDGSIESFDITDGVPVSNGDAQNAAGFPTDNFPDGVIITEDGHYAIFGDDSSGAAVEVSDISSGHLSPSILYNLPDGFNSNNVLLSPDETLLYITNNTSGQVSAAFFDATSGVIAGSCISAQLNGFDSSFSFLSTPVTQLPTGTGSALYLAEFGAPSSIAIVNISVSSGACTLTEAASSPVTNPNSLALVSIAVLQNTQPGLYNPAPGSTLPGSATTFQWYGDPSATAFWLDVGSTAGGHDYYSSNSLPTTTLSATVSGLPTNASTIYVTLYWLINGSWVQNPYTFTAFNATAGAGILTTPAPSSTLTASSVTFGWTAGPTTSAYWLDVGSTAGSHNYFSSGNLGNVLTRTVNGLPTDGSTIYVTLYSLEAGAWTSEGYIYTAYNLSAAGGVMQTPTPGSILTGSSVTFTWLAGAGASGYWIDAGSTAGSHNYSSSGNLGNVLTTTVNGLPTDGSSVYITLYTLINGVWTGNAYSYTALNAPGRLAIMQTTP